MAPKTKWLLAWSATIAIGCGGDETSRVDNDVAASLGLVGAWVEQGPSAFRALVLTPEAATSQANRFFADVDTEGLCPPKTSCPPIVRVEGTFTAGKSNVTFKATTAPDFVLPLLGKYAYLRTGESLSLSRKGVSHSLARADSYCAAASAVSDCTAQQLEHAECSGQWACSSGQMCLWSCASESACGGSAPPLPSKVSLGGADHSAIAVGDVDGDGCTDIAGFVVEGGTKMSLVVAWGDPSGTWAKRWSRIVREVPASQPGEPPALGTRDTSARVVAIGDWNADGALDVVTAAGAALGGGGRSLEWKPLPGEKDQALFPAVLADLEGSGQAEIVRVSTAGRVERCDAAGSCNALEATAPKWSPIPHASHADLVVADFDRDGHGDVLAGTSFDDPTRSWLWRSTKNYAQPGPLQDLHCVELQVGDVDADGHPDVVAQKNEFISDFPSHTQVWLSTKSGFEPVQTLYNFENHNDVAALVDIDGDACVDYLQIGVDTGAAGLRRGTCAFLGSHDPSSAVDAGGWESIPATGGIGVQVLDVNGDGKSELVIRASDWAQAKSGALHFVPVP